MTALAEYARREGVFAWLAARIVGAAGGSRARLLLLVYAAGVVTTALLSNDATIVVLTPAVLAVLARTDAAPEPYLFACAFVANAASLVLPIANPSNLVFFARGLPPLGAWFASFGLASAVAIVLTYAVIAFAFRRDLAGGFAIDDGHATAPRAIACVLLVAAAGALIAVASLGGPLGRTAFALGAVATLVTAARDRGEAIGVVRGVAWRVVALTAALFVVVELLDAAGARVLPRGLFAAAAGLWPPLGRVTVAGAAALASNAVTNLPVGLDLGSYVATHRTPGALGAAALVGVNVGPNFSAYGSLASLLWLAILRRAGIRISVLRFAAVGAAVTPLALAGAALAAR